MKLKIVLTVMASLAVWASPVIAEDVLIENFEVQPEARWQFIADTVMGGVSTGQVEFVQGEGNAYAHMTGRVSTQNNGGFIQFRMELPAPLPKNASGLRLVVREMSNPTSCTCGPAVLFCRGNTIRLVLRRPKNGRRCACLLPTSRLPDGSCERNQDLKL